MFLGFTNDLNDNNIIPLLQFNNKWTLTSYNNDFFLVSNICQHQNSIIVTRPNNHRICPYHGWTWSTDGSPLSSGATQSYCINTKNLKTKKIYKWKNLLFENEVDDLSSLNFINFNYMKLVDKRIDVIKSSYITIMNIFQDEYHVSVLHKGVYDEIGISDTDLEWIYNKNSSIQLSKIKQNKEAINFQRTLRSEDKNLKYGSAWIAIYPYTMIEWQPGVIFITVSIPENNNLTNVLVYKYKDIRYSDENWKINSNVWETSWKQDSEQAERTIGTLLPNMEPGQRHFLDWMSNPPL